MGRRLRNDSGRMLRAMLRGTAALALAAKFLVPVGYMPSSLADGGPIRLCDSGPAGALAEQRGALARHDSDHGAHAAEPAAADASPSIEPAGDSMPADRHDHDDPSASHHDWERCSLGGLASLAAIAGDWHFALPGIRPARIRVADDPAFTRPTVVPFRSRAPPLAHA